MTNKPNPLSSQVDRREVALQLLDKYYELRREVKILHTIIHRNPLAAQVADRMRLQDLTQEYTTVRDQIVELMGVDA